jgi:septal ring factor EnvC (AmiA/AmiB activator)
MAAKEERPSSPAGPTMSAAAMVLNALGAQSRALEQSRGWFESLLSLLEDQAESSTALLHAAESTLRAMEKAITSQAESTRALTDSVDASRRMITSAVTTQQRAIEQVETMFAGTLDVLTTQLEALRSQVEGSQELLASPLAASSEAFLTLTKDWADAYSGLLESLPASSPSTGTAKGTGRSQ